MLNLATTLAFEDRLKFGVLMCLHASNQNILKLIDFEEQLFSIDRPGMLFKGKITETKCNNQELLGVKIILIKSIRDQKMSRQKQIFYAQ